MNGEATTNELDILTRLIKQLAIIYTGEKKKEEDVKHQRRKRYNGRINHIHQVWCGIQQVYE